MGICHQETCTTIGDQLKTVDSSSKVFGVSLKDREQFYQLVYQQMGIWMNSKGDWITSTFTTVNFPCG